MINANKPKPKPLALDVGFATGATTLLIGAGVTLTGDEDGLATGAGVVVNATGAGVVAGVVGAGVVAGVTGAGVVAGVGVVALTLEGMGVALEFAPQQNLLAKATSVEQTVSLLTKTAICAACSHVTLIVVSGTIMEGCVMLSPLGQSGQRSEAEVPGHPHQPEKSIPYSVLLGHC